MADKLVDDLQRALGDAYTIERELTGGGMSRVFVAREHALGREVVIKVLPPDLAAGVNRDRFRREVQLAARLSHPYIVPLLHAGEHGELLWFTMPYIAGESLRTRLERSGPLAAPEVVKLLRDVVEALAYAHSRGVIHRDIKPGNILSDGHHAMVTDFGVAKALNAALPMGGPGHTTSGMAIGTPAYMAPEQLAADPDADHRVDIYAVGLLAYELLSGASPFAAPSPTATMTAQLTSMPEPLHQLRADVPTALSDLVQHCLAKSPEDRPADAQAVLAELDRISGAMAAHVHRAAHGTLAARPHASNLPLILATAGVVALMVGGFWWTQRNAVKQAAAPAPATATHLNDTGDLNVPLPTRPMTRQDSLNIAEALRDQLAQIDPKYQKKPAVTQKATPELPLGVQVRLLDSLIRVDLQRLSQQRIAIDRGGSATGISRLQVPATAVQPGALAYPPPLAPGLPSAAPTHLVIMASPQRRDSGSDSTLQALQRLAVADLAHRASRFGEWSSVVVDTAGRGARTEMGHSTNADVLVFLTMQREDDSVRLRVGVRNAAPGTNFGYRVLTSDPAYRPENLTPFASTLRDASRLLGQLRRLPAGQVWSQDMGRAGMGIGGPNVSATFRGFNPTQFDTLRKLADSLRGQHARHRDSQP